ncbi:MAG: transcriptional repressor [Rhodospirillales bacterium]|nr:transcriptional repressor [Rhodospirillales bacterium]
MPGFAAAIETALERAEQHCLARGARLTALRREVLGLILDRSAPVGAYELLDALQARRGPAAPPTVYRALDFLQEQGLVHRIERLSAYIGCLGHAHGEAGTEHAAQFLICRACGQAFEIDDHALEAALGAAAAKLGFTLGRATIEAEGVCAACRAACRAAG